MSNLKLTNWDKNMAFTLDAKGEVIATNALDTDAKLGTLGSIVHVGPNYGKQDVDLVTPTGLRGFYLLVDVEITASNLASIVFTLQHATTLDGTYEDALSFTHTAATSGKVLKGVNLMEQIPMGKVLRSYVKLKYAGTGASLGKFLTGSVTALLGTCVATTPLTGYQRAPRHGVFTGR